MNSKGIELIRDIHAYFEQHGPPTTEGEKLMQKAELFLTENLPDVNTLDRRQLDRAVAQEVMMLGSKTAEMPVPLYSTSLAQTWAVVRKMRELGFGYVFSDSINGPTHLARFVGCKVRLPRNTMAAGESLPVAICKAAILTVRRMRLERGT